MKEIPKIVVTLRVKYYQSQKDGTTERLIPCYSWGECGQHEAHLCGIADVERVEI
ncbi:MAG: hypothetical protein KGJ90_05175 [Patescibacteria group bacterium]|nr:hypothetical protein [Patescibacteria group bacterium]